MEQKIQTLLEETETWQLIHRKAGRPIDAAYCAIRADAFREILEAFKKEKQ